MSSHKNFSLENKYTNTIDLYTCDLKCKNNIFCVEKQNHHNTRSSSPVRYVETVRTNGHAHGHKRNPVESSYSKTYESFRREYQNSIEERQRTPSPPIRRRSREQVCTFFFILYMYINNIYHFINNL